MKKILFLAPSLDRPNLSRPLLIGIALAKKAKVTIVGPAVRERQFFMRSGKVTMFFLENSSLLPQITESLKLAKQNDVVVACDVRIYSAVTGVIARFFGKRFIFDVGDDEIAASVFDLKTKPKKQKARIIIRLLQIKIGFLLRHFANQITVASKLLQKKYGGQILPVPVDTDFYPNGNPDRFHKLKKPVVLHFGAIQRFKGIEKLIEAFKIVKKEIPEATLLFAGTQEGSPFFSSRIKEWAKTISPDIVFLSGIKNNDDTRDVLAMADVAVYVSKNNAIHNAQHPIKLNLLMASGRPIVAEKIGNAPNILKEAAFYVDSNPESIAQGIIRVLKDNDLSISLAKKSYQRARKYYSFENFEKKHQVFLSVDKL